MSLYIHSFSWDVWQRKAKDEVSLFYFLYSFFLSGMNPGFHSALKLLSILGPLSCLLPASFHGEGTWENLSFEGVEYDWFSPIKKSLEQQKFIWPFKPSGWRSTCSSSRAHSWSCLWGSRICPSRSSRDAINLFSLLNVKSFKIKYWKVGFHGISEDDWSLDMNKVIV